MANCDDARNYVKSQLGEAASAVSAGELDNLVTSCCPDYSSAACQDAISAVLATLGCDVVTAGACVPCCQAIGPIVGPLISGGVRLFVSGVKSLWNAVSSLFGGGSCDYDPAARDLSSGYEALLTGLIDRTWLAWTEARKAAGFDEQEPWSEIWKRAKTDSDLQRYVNTNMTDDEMAEVDQLRRDRRRVFVIRDEDAMLIPITVDQWLADPSVRSAWEEDWSAVFMNNLVCALDKSGYPWFQWKLKGHDDALLQCPPVARNVKPESYFYFWWRAWPCNAGDAWGSSAQDVLAKRAAPLQTAAAWFATAIPAAVVAAQNAVRKSLTSSGARSQLGRAAAKLSRVPEGPSGWWLAAPMLLAAAAGGGLYLWRRYRPATL